MNSPRFVAALAAHVLVGAALVCCGSSHQTSGVTNVQAPGEPGVAPSGQCLSRGTTCLTDNDCCSEWCANGHCATKSP
jgi:hypothetical protein